MASGAELSRRSLMAGVAAGSSGLLAGCSVLPSASLFAESVLFVPASINLVTNFISTHFVEPAYQKLMPVAQAAEANGANPQACIAAAKLAGGDFVLKCLAEKRAIWASYNDNVGGVNGFTVTVTSHSSDPRDNGGQFNFELVDAETGAAEAHFWGNPFEIRPYATVQLSYGPYRRKFFPAGAKMIRLRNGPAGVQVSDVTIAVLPFTVRA